MSHQSELSDFLTFSTFAFLLMQIFPLSFGMLAKHLPMVHTISMCSEGFPEFFPLNLSN